MPQSPERLPREGGAAQQAGFLLGAQGLAALPAPASWGRVNLGDLLWSWGVHGDTVWSRLALLVYGR